MTVTRPQLPRNSGSISAPNRERSAPVKTGLATAQQQKHFQCIPHRISCNRLQILKYRSKDLNVFRMPKGLYRP